MAQRATTAGLGLALLSAATFGTSGTFARSLIEAGWSAEAAVAARVGIAALVLAIPTAVALRGKGHVLLRNLRAIGLFGILAVGGAQVCFFNAVQYVPIGVALLLEYLGIILVVFWMWAAHGQRPTRLTVGGAVAALAGLVLVLNLTSGDGISGVGVLWGLGAAVGLAAYFVLSARVDEELPSVALAAGGMGLGSAVLLILGGVGVLPLHATFGDVTFAGRVVSWVVPILGLSLIAAAFAYVTGIGAARVLGARLSSFVGLTEVLFAVLFAWLILDELPTVVQLLGGVLIVAGVALVRLGERTPPAADATPTSPADTPELVDALPR
ncbi:DMT family transporter [Hamadaea sp. NPDC051192]|uniref:EamA family transporter n=1 Tax=Hamadaea sp. NPDC051192 TaxID=3154940 RepID=UPI003424E522